MYEVKGHTYLIEACRLLRERGVDFVCHLVGDGPDRPALTQQVAQAELLTGYISTDGEPARRSLNSCAGRTSLWPRACQPETAGARAFRLC